MANRTELSKSKRQKVLAKYNHSCIDCGAKGLLEIHHHRLISCGGKNGIKNLIVVCRVCHVIRHGGIPKKLLKSPYWIALRERSPFSVSQWMMKEVGL